MGESVSRVYGVLWCKCTWTESGSAWSGCCVVRYHLRHLTSLHIASISGSTGWHRNIFRGREILSVKTRQQARWRMSQFATDRNLRARAWTHGKYIIPSSGRTHLLGITSARGSSFAEIDLLKFSISLDRDQSWERSREFCYRFFSSRTRSLCRRTLTASWRRMSYMCIHGIRVGRK